MAMFTFGSCHVRLFATLSTVAHQAPLSMGFSREEYWSGLPFPPPGDLPDPGIEPGFSASPALVSGFFTTMPLGKPLPYACISELLRGGIFLCNLAVDSNQREITIFSLFYC